MTNRLVEIELDKWTALRDLYAEHKDRASSYVTIQTFIDWIKKESWLPLRIYSLNGEWETDGTYVALYDGADFCPLVYCNTLSDNMQRLVSSLNCLDPSRYHMISGFQERIYPAIERHFIDIGLKKEQLVANGTVWFHIPKSEALKFSTEPPENTTLKPLDESHANQVTNVWPLRRDGALAFVKLLLRMNESIGLFEGDELKAWCLKLPLGSLGLLQVEEAHKRKGLGSLAVRCMSKLLAEKDIDATAPVVFANVASRTLFEKSGFQIIDKVYWAGRPAVE